MGVGAFSWKQLFIVINMSWIRRPSSVLHSFFFIRIYFIRISRLTFEKFQEYFILCVETAVLMQCNFMFLT